MTERRARILTDADIQAIRDELKCNSQCSFTSEEVQFVKDWMDTAKTAKSEIVRWMVRIAIVGIGLVAGIQVAFKMGYFKAGGK